MARGRVPGAFGRGRGPQDNPPKVRGQKPPRNKDPQRMTEHELLEEISNLRQRANERRNSLLEKNTPVSKVNADGSIAKWTKNADGLSEIRKNRFG